jgi:hypothetical protein
MPVPYRDVERACRLAREASDGGDAIGSVTRAECLITFAEKADEPFALARELARKAQLTGSSAGSFTLYTIFTLDPRYSYVVNGKADTAKYNALAASPISERVDQIEAFGGLADAMRAGHVNAAILALVFLVESSAPGNVDRVLGLATYLQKIGEQIPQRLQPLVRMAQEIKKLGTTHASVSAFNNAFQSAIVAANLQIRGISGVPNCDAKDIRLLKVNADPVENAEYLPILKVPLLNTYLVRGNWQETWQFEGCQKNAQIKLNFTADGWSGAKFQTAPITPTTNNTQ